MNYSKTVIFGYWVPLTDYFYTSSFNFCIHHTAAATAHQQLFAVTDPWTLWFSDKQMWIAEDSLISVFSEF